MLPCRNLEELPWTISQPDVHHLRGSLSARWPVLLAFCGMPANGCWDSDHRVSESSTLCGGLRDRGPPAVPDDRCLSPSCNDTILQTLASGPHTDSSQESVRSYIAQARCSTACCGLHFFIVFVSCVRTLAPGRVSDASSAVLRRQAIWRAVRSGGPHSDLPAHQRSRARGAWPHAWAEHWHHDWGAGCPFNGAAGPLRLWRCH